MRTLPMDLLLSIFSCLPLLQLHQLRLVCKSWNSMLKSHELFRAWSSHQSSLKRHPSPWLLMARWDKKTMMEQEFFVYVCNKDATVPMSPSSLPPPTPIPPLYPGKWFPSRHLISHENHLRSTLMSASGNLVCFLNAQDDDVMPKRPDSLILIDISTRDVRYLDLPVDFVGQKWDTVLKLITNANADSATHTYANANDKRSNPAIHGESELYCTYSIVLMTSFYSRVDVYNSKTKAWSKGSPIREAKDSDWSTIHQADTFHVDIPSPKCGHIFGYHVEGDAWSRITLDPLPQLAHDSHVFITRHKDRLLLVSVLMESNNVEQGLRCHRPREYGFGVWELLSQPSTPSSMPPPHELSSSISPYSLSSSAKINISQVSMLEAPSLFSMENPSLENSSNMCPNKSYSLKFMASEDIISITGVLSGKNDKYMSPIIYDIISNSWHQLPSYHDRADFLGICAFTPRFQTLASL